MEATKLDEILHQISSLNNQISQMATYSQKSTVAEVLLNLTPIVALSLGGILLFFFLLWQYKLRRALIQSGQYTAFISLKKIRILSVLFGINGILLGSCLSLVFLLLNGINYSLLGGLIPLSLGFGMIIFYCITRKQD